MARTDGEKGRELEGVLHEAAGCLSPMHVAALVTRPDAVRSALAVAPDVLSMDGGAPSPSAWVPARQFGAWRRFPESARPRCC